MLSNRHAFRCFCVVVAVCAASSPAIWSSGVSLGFTSRQTARSYWSVALLGENQLLAADERNQDAESLYEPQEADYRKAYDADKANHSKQTWRDYYRWVQIFYRGNLLAEGWTNLAKQVIARIKGKPVQQKTIKTINRLGRRISEEWSKDNGVRKIDTQDLNSFGRQLKEAMKHDNGSGDAIHKALEKIDEVVSKKLGHEAKAVR